MNPRGLSDRLVDDTTVDEEEAGHRIGDLAGSRIGNIARVNAVAVFDTITRGPIGQTLRSAAARVSGCDHDVDIPLKSAPRARGSPRAGAAGPRP